MKGIIYKIVCNETGEVYFGSTTRTLNQRIINHKSEFKRYQEHKNKKFTTSFRIIERNNYSYETVEEIEFEDKIELLKRERWYIENNECINNCIPYRNEDEKKDYIIEHKEDYKEKRKIRDAKNRELLNQKMRDYRQKNIEKIREYDRQRRKLKKSNDTI